MTDKKLSSESEETYLQKQIYADLDKLPSQVSEQFKKYAETWDAQVVWAIRTF